MCNVINREMLLLNSKGCCVNHDDVKHNLSGPYAIWLIVHAQYPNKQNLMLPFHHMCSIVSSIGIYCCLHISFTYISIAFKKYRWHKYFMLHGHFRKDTMFQNTNITHCIVLYSNMMFSREQFFQ